MPNWCLDTVEIRADDEQELDAVLEAVKGRDPEYPEPFSLASILPVPKEVEEDPDGMVGYMWRVDNWGTKWDVREVHFERTPGRLFFQFESAWAPPTMAIEALAVRFPNVMVGLAFDEPGMDFGGYVVFRGEDIVDQMDGGSRMSSWDELMDWGGF